jgi:glycosyltransferase involved in cell wall biosynthesis
MERFLGDLAGAQRAAGGDVAVLVHEIKSTDSGGDPAWVMRCPVCFQLVFAPVSPAFPLWLNRAIRRFAPDVLHMHMPNPSCFWGLLLPAARALPWVVHWHSDVERSRFRLALRLAYPPYRIFERAMLKRAQAIVVTSPQYLEASRALRPWRLKCHVIPLALDPARLAEVARHEHAGLWRGGGLRLLAIGRLTYYKGFDTLIRAVAAAADMELVIVGEGEERSSLEKVLTGHGNPPWIRLLGQVEDATCQRLLASCDVFCLPSRERTEAFGIVLMEAMRYGKPLLASRLEGSGVTWLVQDGLNGMLVAPDSPPAWREALDLLARDPQLRQRLGESGRRRFEREFDIAHTASRLSDLYATLSAEGRVDAAREDP